MLKFWPGIPQGGLAMVSAWLGHIGRAWTGEPSDIAAALQHVHQAIQFLLRVSSEDLTACRDRSGCHSCDILAYQSGQQDEALHSKKTTSSSCLNDGAASRSYTSMHCVSTTDFRPFWSVYQYATLTQKARTAHIVFVTTYVPVSTHMGWEVMVGHKATPH